LISLQPVVDTHPDTLHTLRIDAPFPALKKYATEMDLEAMDSMEHSHVPYVALLVKTLEDWKSTVRQSFEEHKSTAHLKVKMSLFLGSMKARIRHTMTWRISRTS
jgi:amyloid beta precursor protein binding protein 1